MTIATTSLGEAAAIGRIEKALFGGDDRLVTLGRYAIRQLIGSGAFAKVYRAHDPELARDIALKVLTATGDADREELLHEARVLATIGHPNVVAVHDAGIVRDDARGRLRVFIAMELVAGTSLRDWLARAPRTRAQILDVLRQAGRGLAAAHAAGLVHRDFKPENVLVGDDGRVRVVDFGLARPHSDTTEAVAGTPAYMAPEQLAGEPATPAADQFAFAVTLWEALHGERPFTGATIAELRAAMAHPPSAPRALRVHAAEAPTLPALEPHATTDKRDAAPDHASPGNRSAATDNASPDNASPDNASPDNAATDKRTGARDDASTDDMSPRRPARRVRRSGRPPRSIVRALTRGLALEPAARFPSIDAMLAALEMRRARWVVPVIVASVAAAASAIVVVQARGREEPCPVPIGELSGVWDLQRRVAIAKAFAATGAPFAPASFERTAATLDRATAAWLAGRRDACEATAVRHEQSAELLDRRIACLADWERQLRALTDALAAATPAVAQNAVQAVSDLPPLARCADREALADVPLPPDRDAVDALFDKLAGARSLHLAGKITEALAISDQVAADPIAAKYPPLGIAAALWQSEIQLALNQHDAARASARHAFDLAIGIADKRSAAQAAANVAFASAFDASRATDALQWVATGRSQLQGVDSSLELDAKLANAEGNIHLTRGDPTAAEQPMLRAVNDFAQLDPDHPNIGSSLAMLGISELDRGKLKDADTHLRDALEREKRTLGPDHPEVATTLINVSLVDSAEGHYRAAARDVDRGIALMTELYGADYVLIAYAELARGEIALALGEPGEPHFTAATRIAEASFGAHPVTAQTLLGHADYLVRTGHAREAVPLATRARDMLAAAIGPGDTGLAVAEATLARAEGNLARARSAVELCRAAPAGTPGAGCAIVYQVYGDLLLASGDRAGAAAQLRTAIASLATGTPDPLRLAELRLALAAATGDAALAKQARAELPADARLP